TLSAPLRQTASAAPYRDRGAVPRSAPPDVPAGTGRVHRTERAGLPGTTRRRTFPLLRAQGPGWRDADTFGTDGIRLRRCVRRDATRRVRDPAARLHGGRIDALPA